MTLDKKILCIGNETPDSDILTGQLAQQNYTTNHGLIDCANFVPQHPGFYHTSLADISSGDIIMHLVDKFDEIKMLDQHINSYPHWKSFVHTFKLFIELEKNDLKTDFRNNQHNKTILYWFNLLRENKSFCIYPFINLINDFGYASQCQKGGHPVTKIELIKDWSTDPAFSKIRNSMLAGSKMHLRCNTCYQKEALGNESTRQFESLEWVMELGLQTLEDVKKITQPVLYEIRPSNKCNIMCRMCDDKHSHLIEKENKKIGLPVTTDVWRFQDFPYERIDFATVKRIYWGGGEPTIMPEFYAFLRRCIQQKQTHFYLSIGTNGQKISDTLLDLLKEFPNVNFSVSFDGYQRVNDYIRWGSDFDTVRQNCFRILEQGHQLAFQTVFSMYNATRIHEVYEFYDRDFSGSNTLVQTAGLPGDILNPWQNPLKQQVLESMYRCRETKVYYNNGRNTDSLVEQMIKYYTDNSSDHEVVRKFFEYNDKLDKSRSTNLADYIPELAAARKSIA